MRPQASRLNRPPALLAGLIECVNLIPPESEMPDFADLISANESGPTAVMTAFQKMVEERFPPEFREMLGPIREQTFATATQRYILFRAARETLRTVARMPSKSQLVPLPPPLGLEQFLEAEINDDGRIELSARPLLEALRGVEAARIRQCPICQRIFWAGRKDQPACTNRCTHALRTRRWRARYLDSYKPQRYVRAEKRERK